MIDIHLHNFIPIFHFFPTARSLSLNGHKFPNIILRNMIASVGTTRYLVVQFALRMLNFVSMKIIFSFQVAQNHRITDDVQLAIAIDFVQ